MSSKRFIILFAYPASPALLRWRRTAGTVNRGETPIKIITNSPKSVLYMWRSVLWEKIGWVELQGTSLALWQLRATTGLHIYPYPGFPLPGINSDFIAKFPTIAPNYPWSIHVGLFRAVNFHVIAFLLIVHYCIVQILHCAHCVLCISRFLFYVSITKISANSIPVTM